MPSRENSQPLVVTTQGQLVELCRRLADQPLLAFDTEFVAEDSYRPELCLLQVASEGVVAVVDPLSVGELGGFWELLVERSRTTIVHAGREEVLFHFRSTGEKIGSLFDIQTAAGFLGYDYPASYGNLVYRFTGQVLDKEETRSDWRRRPLSPRQLVYASQDVRDLPKIYGILKQKLEELGRLEWLQEELDERQTDLTTTETQEQWHRLSGVHALTGASLAIARGLWNWRDQQARQKDIPPRRVLRDDLLVELSRRGTSDPKRIASLRGMEHRHLKLLLPELSRVIAESRDAEAPKWPRKLKYGSGQPPGMLTQYLGAALALICRKQAIAPSIVGTSDDLRDFVLYRTDNRNRTVPPPALLTGWRATIVGKQLDELLSGTAAISIADLESDVPLQFCKVGRDS